MEGNITPVLAILNEWMKIIELGGGVPINMEDYTPSPEIYLLDKKCGGGNNIYGITSIGKIIV